MKGIREEFNYVLDTFSGRYQLLSFLVSGLIFHAKIARIKALNLLSSRKMEGVGTGDNMHTLIHTVSIIENIFRGSNIMKNNIKSLNVNLHHHMTC